MTEPSADPGWDHLEHGADIGVRGHGATRERAFEQAGLVRAVARLRPMVCVKG